MDAKGRLVEVDPDYADRPVRPRRQGQRLVIVALLEVEVGVVGIGRVDGDGGDLEGAIRRGRLAGAHGHGVIRHDAAILGAGDQAAGGLVDLDLRDRPFGALLHVEHMDLAARAEIAAGVQGAQEIHVKVEFLGQRLCRVGVAQQVLLGQFGVILGQAAGDLREIFLGHGMGARDARCLRTAQPGPDFRIHLAVHGQTLAGLECGNCAGGHAAAKSVDHAGRDIGAVQQHLHLGGDRRLPLGQRAAFIGGGVDGLGVGGGKSGKRGKGQKADQDEGAQGMLQ